MNLSPKCRLCEGDQLLNKPLSQTHYLQTCESCGLVEQIVSTDADEQITAGHTLPDCQGSDLREQGELVLNRLRSLVGKQSSRNRLLHINCHRGHLLEAAQRRGWKAVGVDHRRKSLDFCRSRKLEVFHASGHKLPFDAGCFDVVVAWDLVDQLTDPARSLKEWKRVLRSTGVLLVETANAERDMNNKQQDLSAFWSPQRRFGFSNATLERWLRRAGFEIEAAPSVGSLAQLGIGGALKNSKLVAKSWWARAAGKQTRIELFARKPQAQSESPDWKVEKLKRAA